MRLIILGPPGAGKGTQAARIADELGIPAISTGDIFRANIKGKTELGLKVADILAAGQYVPDELTNAIVADRLAEEDAADGFLLDGYPRTPDQVEALDALLAERGESLDAAVELMVPVDEVVDRLLKRAAVEGREDDTDDVIRERLRVYARETEPLAAAFDERGLLRRVDGRGEMDAVFERVLQALGRTKTA